MTQLVFKFPFKKRYFEQDFYVSKNNFSAYKLIESWPIGLGSGSIYTVLQVQEKLIYLKL